MVPLWKILHLAGADWTYGTKGWAAENYCMFLAEDEAIGSISSRSRPKAVEDLGCQILAQYRMRSRTVRSPAGLKKFNIPRSQFRRSKASFNTTPNGFGKANSRSTRTGTKTCKVKFTVQDPCQLVRKSFGDPVAEDLRYVVKIGRRGRKLHRYGIQPLQQLLLRRRRRLSAVRASRRRAGNTGI
jgi:hypothetical protein